MDAWETFLPIAKSLRLDEAPTADSMFLASRGIDADAPIVIAHLRRDVLPLIRALEQGAIIWYAFLIHDRNSGVPTTADDDRAFIHLRLKFEHDPLNNWDLAEFLTDGHWLRQPSPWVLTRRCELSTDMAGVDCHALRGKSEHAWQLLGAQSEWVLDLIEAHVPDADNYTMLKHCRQFLHFFANMLQMRVA